MSSNSRHRSPAVRRYNSRHMTGGDALVATLLAHDVRQAFCVPGESFLAVLEALRRERQRIRLVVTRHESGATFAAEAYGKLARHPAAVFVTRGPGATNGAIGIHTAAQDSTPLVLFIGHVPTSAKGRESFQEIDYHRMYGPIAKAVFEPVSAAHVAEFTARAIRLAVAGRPGPTVVVLPEDVTEGDAGPVSIPAAPPRPRSAPPPDVVARTAALLAAARCPIVISGEMVAFDDATDALVRVAERSGAAVVTAWRRQDTFPNDHRAYAGHFGIGRAPFQREAWAQCDLVIAAGTRLDDITTEEFTLLRDDQRLVQIHPDPAVLARARSTVAIAADTATVLSALADAIETAPPPARLEWRERLHTAFLAFTTAGQVPVHGAVDPARVVEAVAALLPPEAVITNDAGNFAGWVHRYYPFTRPATQAAPSSGAMGYAVPGALGAALAHPDRPVVAFVGDGGFLMTGQELVTAVQEALPIKVVLGDNSAYGTIAMHQVKRIGMEALFGVHLVSPDFAAVARGYGAAAFTVEKTAECSDAFAAALRHSGPALVHVKTDLQDISASGPLPARLA
jgi:acetolactate synthase I/II/III large subunit